MTRQPGFTLLEIVIALGIAVIVSAGIAPLLYSARMMSEARGVFAKSNKERSAANRIFADVRSSSGLNIKAPLKIAKFEAIETGENDFLAVRALSTATDTAHPLGTAVWGVPGGVTVRGGFEPGLYRWIVSPDMTPSAVDATKLDPGDGTLVLPGAASVTFAVLRGSEWVRDYGGAMPRAFRVTFNYGDDSASYEEILPNF